MYINRSRKVTKKFLCEEKLIANAGSSNRVMRRTLSMPMAYLVKFGASGTDMDRRRDSFDLENAMF